MRSNGLIRGKGIVAGICLAVLIGAANSDGARADSLPSVRVGTAALITPTQAQTYYGTDLTHTNGLAAMGVPNTARPPEIVEMARALGNVDRIYEYVHNNIDVAWMFGMQKGALGALIDKSGTAFDQAMLMIELSRQAGYVARYRIGTIGFTSQDQPGHHEFYDWTGITNGKAACQMLANGGIPAIVRTATLPSGSQLCSDYNSDVVQSVTLMHVWVEVRIGPDGGPGSTWYTFDPTVKTYNWKPGIDFAATIGFTHNAAYNAATVSASGTLPSTSVPYIRGVNASGLNGVIATYADGILTYASAHPEAELEDIISGGRIAPYYSPSGGLRQTSNPYKESIQSNWGNSANVPNQYRTTLQTKMEKDFGDGTVQALFDKTFYADEIYGRRLMVGTGFQQGNIFENVATDKSASELYLDDVAIPGTLVVNGGTLIPRYYSNLYLNARHPYAASADGTPTTAGDYMDTDIKKRVILVLGLTILHGWGDTGPALMAKWSNERRNILLPVPKNSPRCEGGTAHCPNYYKGSSGDMDRANGAAGWLGQFTRASHMHAALAHSIVQIHHSLGAVYADVDLEFAYGACPGLGCTIPYDIIAADNTMQIDVDTGISLSSKTADSTARRAALHAIAATGAALEGSVVAQLADLVDMFSSATRFEWGNAPPAADDPPLAGPRNFVQFDSTNYSSSAGAVLFEGQATWPPPSNCTNYPEGARKWYSNFEDSLSKAINQYADPTSHPGILFTVVASQESFLGPGMRDGALAPHAVGAGYECAATRQRGGALVAMHVDSNGDPVDIAHIVSGFDTTSKGGGGGTPPDAQKLYDPAQAADILKSQFVDRSSAMGVSLSDGSMSYTAPASLSIGNGGFPYELSASLSWKPGDRDGRVGPIIATKPNPGWATSWQNDLSISSSAMEAMGQSDVRAASGTLAAFLVTQDIFNYTPNVSGEFAPSLRRTVAGVLTQAWWLHTLSGNVVTVAIGTSSRQFVRLYNGAWIAPGAGPYTTLTQTGDRAATTELCETDTSPYATSKGWSYDGVSFVVTNAAGDKQNFVPWSAHYAVNQESRCGKAKGLRLSTWTFPYGMTITLDYGAPYDPKSTTAEYELERITGVHNSYNREIKFTTTRMDGELEGFYTQSPTRTVAVTLDIDKVVTAIADPLSHATTFAYNAPVARSETTRPIDYANLYRVFTADAPTLPNLEYTYDTVGHVKEVRDAVALQVGGRDPYSFFIADGTRGQREDPLGQVYTVVYDTYGRPARYLDEQNALTTAEFDARGRVTRYTFPEGNQERRTYDDRNNVTELRQVAKPGCTEPPEPAGACADIVIGATWDSSWNKPLTITDARGNVTTFDYYASGDGNSLMHTATRPDPDGGGPLAQPVYTFTYATYGRVDTTTDPTGLVVKNVYLSNGDLDTSTLDYGTGHLNAVTDYGYDTVGNTTSVLDPNGHATTTDYNSNRQKTLVYGRDGGVTATTLLSASRFTYDNVGRVTLEEAAKCFTGPASCDQSGPAVDTWIAAKTTVYTPTGKPYTVTDADSRTTTTDYDGLDRALTVTDPIGRKVHYEYCEPTDTNCAALAVRIEWRAWGSALQQAYETYTYTANGKQATVYDANGATHITAYAYDHHDRLSQTTFPDATYEALSYDPNGNILTRRTRAAETIAFQYNTLNWVAQKTTPERVTTSAYDLAGRLEQISDDAGYAINPEYTSTQAFRMTSVIRTVPGLTGTQTVSYQYDAAGNRTRVTWPDAYYVAYGFDALNRMAKACENGTYSGSACASGVTLATYAYDPLSRRTSLTYGNGAAVAYAYTDAGDLTTLSHDLDGSGTTNDVTFTYTYTNAHQLNDTAYSNTLYRWQPRFSDVGTEGYTAANVLDQYPNVTFVSGTSRAMSYDTRGNMTGFGTTTHYAYDSENRMIHAWKTGSGSYDAQYGHDPFGRRQLRNLDGTYTFWLGDTQDDEIAEYSRDGSNNPVLVRRFVPGPGVDEPIAMVTSAGARTYFHEDRIGSVIAMSGDAGALVEGPYTYAPFGEPCNASGSSCGATTSQVPYRFTGRRFDVETALYYYRARQYRTDVGRFMQTDPVGYEADPNMYIYVGNDPQNQTDPLGLASTYCVWQTGPLGNTVRGQCFTDDGTVISSCTNFIVCALWTPIAPPPTASTSGSPPASVSGGGDYIPIIVESRGKNWLPETGAPGSVVTNGPGTGQRKYGPDGKPLQDWNKGHPGARPPEDKDHVHDYKPANPRNPSGKPTRLPGRVPDRPGDLQGPVPPPPPPPPKTVP